MADPDPWTFSHPRYGDGPQGFLKQLDAMEKAASALQAQRKRLPPDNLRKLALYRKMWRGIMAYVHDAREEEGAQEPCPPGRCRLWEQISRDFPPPLAAPSARQCAAAFMEHGCCEGSRGRAGHCLAQIIGRPASEEELDACILGTVQYRAMEADRERRQREGKRQNRNAKQRAVSAAESFADGSLSGAYDDPEGGGLGGGPGLFADP